MLKNNYWLVLVYLLMMISSSVFAQKFAPVSGFARSFVLGSPIINAKITILETGKTISSDKEGNFGPFLYPISKPLTLIIQKPGYVTTQSATVIVPRQGLQGQNNNMTLQVPSKLAFFWLRQLIGAKLDNDKCHVAATITAYQKTMADDPQGEPGANVMLLPHNNSKPYYFGIFKHGPLQEKTNPFIHHLSQTSADGGVAFFNLPASNQLYTLTAVKPNMKFSNAYFLCRSGVFINLSPPQGPKVLK